ncbi:MAG: hypothetical protein Salg2KO_05890 [Salibacteraceae bacterium]
MISVFKKFLGVFTLFALIGGCTKYQIEQNCCEGNWHITTQNFKRPSPFKLHVPQAFTPNGDGLNEQFFPIGTGWDLEKLVIKKGLKTVYESTNRLDAYWDGTDADDGRYKYEMTFRTRGGDMFEANGHVCVMRYGERDGKFYDVETEKVCDCIMFDQLDTIEGVVRQSKECPSNANVPIDTNTSANDTL